MRARRRSCLGTASTPLFCHAPNGTARFSKLNHSKQFDRRVRAVYLTARLSRVSLANFASGAVRRSPGRLRLRKRTRGRLARGRVAGYGLLWRVSAALPADQVCWGDPPRRRRRIMLPRPTDPAIRAAALRPARPWRRPRGARGTGKIAADSPTDHFAFRENRVFRSSPRALGSPIQTNWVLARRTVREVARTS